MARKISKLVLIVLGLLLTPVAIALFWYAAVAFSYEHKIGWLEVPVRYRIALEIAVDGSVHNVSTVAQVTYQQIPQWQSLFGPGIAALYKGQAGCTTLPDEKTICILPGAGNLQVYSDSSRNIPVLANRLLSVNGSATGPKSKWTPTHASSAASVSGSAEIPLDLLPAIIVLDDRLNPASAHLFVPEHPEQSLGPRSRFLGAKISVTDDPVSDNIERTLPWLADQKIPTMLNRRGDAFMVETNGQPLYKGFFY